MIFWNLNRGSPRAESRNRRAQIKLARESASIPPLLQAAIDGNERKVDEMLASGEIVDFNVFELRRVKNKAIRDKLEKKWRRFFIEIGFRRWRNDDKEGAMKNEIIKHKDADSRQSGGAVTPLESARTLLRLTNEIIAEQEAKSHPIQFEEYGALFRGTDTDLYFITFNGYHDACWFTFIPNGAASGTALASWAMTGARCSRNANLLVCLNRISVVREISPYAAKFFFDADSLDDAKQKIRDAYDREFGTTSPPALKTGAAD